MCTLTWWRDSEKPEKFSVFFNRDESKQRSIAAPPTDFETENGTRFLMPIDPDAGGTWMFANEHGVVVCLLNWYDKAVPDLSNRSGFESRGLLVKSLADVREAADLQSRLEALELEKYRPFHLIGFSPNDEAGWSWPGEDSLLTIGLGRKLAGRRSEDSRAPAPQDGPMNEQGLFGEHTLLDRSSERERADDPLAHARRHLVPPISSSSFDTERVLAFRRDFLGQSNPRTAVDFWAFHENFGQRSTAYTPKMNRPDAQTWSRSRVDVSTEKVRFRYVAELPDHAEPPVEYELQELCRSNPA